MYGSRPRRTGVKNCPAKEKTHHKRAVHWTILTRLGPIGVWLIPSILKPIKGQTARGPSNLSDYKFIPFLNCKKSPWCMTAGASRTGVNNCPAKEKSHHKIAIPGTVLTRLGPKETVRLKSFLPAITSQSKDRQPEGLSNLSG